MGNLFSGNTFSFVLRKTFARDYQRRLLPPWPDSTVTFHVGHDYVRCGPQLRCIWAAVPFHVGRDYAMWATITVKQKMRPTSQPNRGPHHTGICGPHPMESPAHLDRNTQQRAVDSILGTSFENADGSEETVVEAVNRLNYRSQGLAA
jgi:hypothetical protein